MIEIIENNYKPEIQEEKRYKHVCKHCQSVFTYSVEDYEEEDRGLYGPVRFMNCPCCGKEVYPYNDEIIEQ